MKRDISGAPRCRPVPRALVIGALALFAPLSASAEVQIAGSPETITIKARDASVEEILSSLSSTIRLRYRTSVALSRPLTGTYEGSLQRVLPRLLEGYDFIVKNADGVIDVVVLGTRGATPSAALPVRAPAPRQAPIAGATGSPAAAPTPAVQPAQSTGSKTGPIEPVIE